MQDPRESHVRDEVYVDLIHYIHNEVPGRSCSTSKLQERAIRDEAASMFPPAPALMEGQARMTPPSQLQET